MKEKTVKYMKAKKKQAYTAVIVLAYCHRYVFLIALVLLAGMFGKEYVLLGMGIGAILYSLYSLVGYLCRWKHIYCSYQNAYHQKMTPDRIRWHKIKKADAYGVPIIFGALGLGLLVCQFAV